MTTPRRPAHRREAHNASIDEQVSDAGGCAQIHLPTGRTCTLPHNHPGTCQFLPPDHVHHDPTPPHPDET